jgi:hypothetical protein
MWTSEFKASLINRTNSRLHRKNKNNKTNKKTTKQILKNNLRRKGVYFHLHVPGHLK